jgi:hypothetical protein
LLDVLGHGFLCRLLELRAPCWYIVLKTLPAFALLKQEIDKNKAKKENTT